MQCSALIFSNVQGPYTGNSKWACFLVYFNFAMRVVIIVITPNRNPSRNRDLYLVTMVIVYVSVYIYNN